MKRDPGDIVETRQYEPTWSDLAPPVLVIIGITIAVALTVVWILGDNPKRKKYTQDSATQLNQKFPKFNWVVCHSPYTPVFDGIEGTDWGHTHHELGISFGKTIGYDLVWARSGTFIRHGDGGFLNWAYNGHITGTENGGLVVHFGKR